MKKLVLVITESYPIHSMSSDIFPGVLPLWIILMCLCVCSCKDLSRHVYTPQIVHQEWWMASMVIFGTSEVWLKEYSYHELWLHMSIKYHLQLVNLTGSMVCNVIPSSSRIVAKDRFINVCIWDCAVRYAGWCFDHRVSPAMYFLPVWDSVPKCTGDMWTLCPLPVWTVAKVEKYSMFYVQR